MQKKLYIIALILMAAVQTVAAQIHFQATAASESSVGGTWRVEFKVNDSDAEEFVPPSFSDFDVLSGPSSSTFSNYQMVNGRISSNSSLTITYLLSPKREGTLTLGSASVEVDGKTYKSKPITVKVNPEQSGGNSSSANNQQSRNQSQEIQQAGSSVTKRDLFFTVTANKKNIYEQQAVVLTYKYYARVGVALTSISLRQKPDMQGFYVEEASLPEELRHETETIDGVLYKTGVYMKYLLFPQKSGKLVVPAITMDCKVAQQQMMRNSFDAFDAFFNGGGHIVIDVQRTAPELTLDVLPLPEPRPVGFSGGVGHFEVNGRVLENSVKTNDVATYRLTVEGNGIMKFLQAPTIDFPADFEVYPPKAVEDIEQTTDGLKGSIAYDYTFVPRNVGDYAIPEVSFTYFDIGAKEYKTVTVPAQQVTIKQGKNVSTNTPSLKKRNEDILPIITDSSIKPGATYAVWFGTWPYYAMLAVLTVLFVAGVAFWKSRIRANADTIGKLRKGARRRVSKHLKNVAAMLERNDTGNAFYAELERCIKQYISDKFSITATSLSQSELAGLLQGKGIDTDTITQFRDVLGECEFRQFSGSAEPAKMDELLTKAETIIEKIETTR